MYTPYYPFRGVEFLCLCISTLMVLHRLLQHTLDQNRHTHAAASDTDRSRHTTGARATKAVLIGGLTTVSTRTMDIFKFVSFIIVSFGVVGIIRGLADAVFYNAMKQHLEAAALEKSGDRHEGQGRQQCGRPADGRRGIAGGAEGSSDTLTPGAPGKHTRTLRRLTQRLQQGADANASVL